MDETGLSVEGVLKQHDRLVVSTLKRFAKGHGRTLTKADVEDLRQEVAMRMVRMRCLERYDPTRCALSTYLFWVVRSVILNVCDRKHDALRDPIAFRSEAADPSERVKGTLVIEWMTDMRAVSAERVQIAKSLADGIAARLVAREQAGRRKQPLAKVFAYMRAGLTPKEISATMGVPSRTISCYVQRIKEEAAAFMPTAVNAW